MMTPKERAAVSIQNESKTVSSLSTMRTAMQQALEALETKGEHHSRVYEAITALRETLDHSGEVNEMVGCAYCNNPLFAGTKCNNCGRVTLAKQAEQEPLVFRTDGVCRMKQFVGGAVEYYDETGNVTAWFDGSLKVGREPIAKVCHDLPSHIGWNPNAAVNEFPEGMPLYAAPVRTKDLTDDELDIFVSEKTMDMRMTLREFARAVIAADREKNK